MKKLWKESKYLIAGHRCVEHAITKEQALVGRYGEIWKYNDTTFLALITSHRIAKRFLSKEKHPVASEDEILIKFPEVELDIWVERLKIPSKPSTQSDLANFKAPILVIRGQNSSLKGKFQSQKDGDHVSIPPAPKDAKSVPLTQNPGNYESADKKSRLPGGGT